MSIWQHFQFMKNSKDLNDLHAAKLVILTIILLYQKGYCKFFYSAGKSPPLLETYQTTVSQNAPEPTKKLLPVILLIYFWWKLWMTSSKTLGIWKFGARPWERPVKAKTLKYCSQGNKDETKFCLYRCTLYPKLFIGLPWTPVVN